MSMTEAPELVPDVLERILIGFDSKELVRLKGVCKSWYSFISGTRFNLNRNKNDILVQTRIFMPMFGDPRTFDQYHAHDSFFEIASCHLLGSSNGLVCISPFDTQVLVVNPFTKEVKKLQNLPIPYRESFCWGFGYDSLTDDYKIVVGFRKGKDRTCFQLFSLKSNVWKVIEELKYSFFGRSGILYNGALHWFMNDKRNNKVILSFDLSQEEFKQIPQPNDPNYKFTYKTYLGTIQECLCIFGSYSFDYPIWQTNCYNVNPVWVMKNHNVKQSWELLPYNREMNNDYAYSLKNLRDYSRIKKSFFYDHLCSSNTGEYMGAPIYVQSLVSPYVNGTPKRKRRAKNNQRKVKLIKGNPASAGV